MPTSQVFKHKRHDSGTTMRITFTPPEDVTWNLQEAGVTVTLIARLPTAGTPKFSAAATVTGPWTITYKPSSTDSDTIGAYDIEAEAVRSTGDKVTLPTEGYLSWVVGADLNNS